MREAVRFQVAAIVGTGLIGGALGMALRQQGCAQTVLGIDRDARAAQRAVERGAVDVASTDLGRLTEAEIVFLAIPPEQVVGVARAALSYLRPHTILTDTASVKAPIVSALERIAPPVRFVGGHPMAGSEGQGIEAADPGFLRNRPYIVTPTGFTDREAVHRLVALAQAIGMRPVVMQPEVHDRLVALISHLPYLVACAVVLTAAEEPESLGVGGPVFGELARVASSPPGLWAQILRLNREEVRRALRDLRGILDRVERRLEEDQLEELLEQAQNAGMRAREPRP
ncbi:MAG: prephenate dehydrogenase/arogenate dehydrogenase family protein [Armatimonadota bacterium]|nr:prephenate dehydrogenase/arogenate dehydrogenase family protein [Armatimonadota bacterium]MDR7438530.1 prephenate dehydrogenase/arogenate dehydrogenase family protein [Armatimonadota bacterium]MDR7562338.1 prephenate dehydrogenase/arogenate dehydrogenase family protein [Armatimonadota bacterium]MDR7567582.1 prephenate dehydrogenase/arogenate dehydrogenase family protein [Armatimonadota bacterium]MDR7601902.1 prephenate dehydrogenase/arogenate dehydrogenase family protein [Armatimonadota bact